MEAGFAEGSRNTHPGQGTANRRFFFRNGMLELLWVHDRDEVTSTQTKLTLLDERSRWRDGGFCPFGIGVYGKADPQQRFRGWAYKPAYLPEDWHIWVADNAMHPQEPMLFHGDFFPEPAASSDREPVVHPNGVSIISQLTVHLNAAKENSSALNIFSSIDLLKFKRSDEPLAILEWDHGVQKRQLDLRPAIPLPIKY